MEPTVSSDVAYVVSEIYKFLFFFFGGVVYFGGMYLIWRHFRKRGNKSAKDES